MVLVQKKQTIPVAFSKKDNNNYWSSMKWTVTQSWSRPEICIDWAWANQTITLRVWQYKSCVNVSDLDITWSWLSCADLTTCPVIVQIQWDINDIEWDITSIQTDITNLQNATSIEAMQDAISSLFVHWNHTNITASYDDVNNQIILSWSTWGWWFSCWDVALCISSNVWTQTALLNWLQSLPSVTLTWDWTFQWVSNFDWDVNFNNNTITIDSSTINSSDSTYNHTNDTINYDANTEINWWMFNNNTFNNPTFTGNIGVGIKRVNEQITGWPAWIFNLANIPMWDIQVSTVGGVIQIETGDYTQTFTTTIDTTGATLLVSYIIGSTLPATPAPEILYSRFRMFS